MSATARRARVNFILSYFVTHKSGITGDSDTESNVSEDSPEEFSEKRLSEPATTSAASSHPEDEEKSNDHQDGPGGNKAS